MLLFVYGTMLRRGRNHQRLYDKRAIFIGEFNTVDTFDMTIRGRGSVPLGMRSAEGHPIAGELYAIDDEMIGEIDAFEGHPIVYERQKVTLCDFNETNGLNVNMYVYVRLTLLAETETVVMPVNGVLRFTP
jgi:gamma-glutamylcyclotransferase (GGCT)/AIG2-like uncharacterized protein YtfP